MASNRIKKKCFRKKSRGILKKSNKKAAAWLRKASYLDTDNLETVDYNNDNNIADLDDIATVDYNNDNNLDDVTTVDYNNDNNLKDLDDVDLKKTSGKQLAAKKIVKIYKKMARKKTYWKISKKTDNDVVFLKQVPVHPRDRLARKTKNDVKFVKQVPLHPRERLKGRLK